MLYRKPRSPYWHFDFQWRGRRFLGSTKTTNKRDAEKVEAAEREKAKQTVAKTEAARTSLRLDDVAGRYWLQGQHYAASRNIWKRLSLLIEFFGKEKLITDITDDDVRALIAWRRGHRVVYKGRKPEDCPLITPDTVNLTVQQLKALFATLRPRVHEPEWRKLWLPVRQEHTRELMGDEGDRLEAATRDDYLAFFAFVQASGQRQNECLLRWSQVDWGARQIKKTGKGGRLLTVPITATIREILWPLRGHHPEFVFTYVAVRTHKQWVKGRRYPITLAGLRAHWHRLRKKAGVTGFRFHDFRHDLATKALRETGNLKLVQKMLNHADIRHTLRYAHVLDGEVAEGFERVARARKSRAKSRTMLREVV
jgi:integrase